MSSSSSSHSDDEFFLVPLDVEEEEAAARPTAAPPPAAAPAEGEEEAYRYMEEVSAEVNNEVNQAIAQEDRHQQEVEQNPVPEGIGEDADSVHSEDSGPMGHSDVDVNDDDDDDDEDDDSILQELATLDPSTTLQEARSRCLRLLKSPAWRNEAQQEQAQDCFLLLLHQYPVLAKERLRNRHFGFKMNALFHLLLASAKLPVIQQVHQLNPKAVTQRYLINVYPLHIACSHCSPDVVEYLVRLYPQALRERSIMSGSPLHQMLSRSRRLELQTSLLLPLLRTMVEFCPESVRQTDIHQRTCLDLAMDYSNLGGGDNNNIEIIRYLVSQLPILMDDDMTEFSLCERRQDAWNMTTAHIQAFSQIFPRLTKLSIGVRHWTNEALTAFFQCLETNSSIITINTLLLPNSEDIVQEESTENDDHQHKSTTSAANSTTTAYLQPFEEFLRYNTALKCLILQCDSWKRDEQRTRYDDYAMEATCRGLSYNRTLSSIQFWHFSLSNYIPYQVFLRDGAAPTTVIFRGCEAWDAVAMRNGGMGDESSSSDCSNTQQQKQHTTTNNNNNNNDDDDWSQCRVEHLKFLDLPPQSPIAFIPRMVRDLARMPLLHTLTLDLGARNLRSTPLHNLTEPMVALLTHCRRLESIRVKGATLNAQQVFESLQYNHRLKRYEINATLAYESSRICLGNVLEQYNTTLEHVVMPQTLLNNESCLAWRKIQYYLLLNSLGRRHLQNPSSVSKRCIVDCLIAATQTVALDVLESASLDVCILHYGLLREMPSVWSDFDYALGRVNEESPAEADCNDRSRGTKRKFDSETINADTIG